MTRDDALIDDLKAVLRRHMDGPLGDEDIERLHLKAIEWLVASCIIFNGTSGDQFIDAIGRGALLVRDVRS